MQIKILLLAFMFSFTAKASFSAQSLFLNENNILVHVSNEIGNANTCIDEYLVRQKKLKKFLIWAPPVTIVAAPAAGLVGGFATAALTNAAGISGWSALGYTILGVAGPGIAVLGTFTTLEVAKGIEYHNNNKMIAIITASHNRVYDHKLLIKLAKKYNRQNPNSVMDVQELAETIVNLDIAGKLCNGEVRGTRHLKLKKRLAKRRHILNYLKFE